MSDDQRKLCFTLFMPNRSGGALIIEDGVSWLPNRDPTANTPLGLGRVRPVGGDAKEKTVRKLGI